MAISRRTLLVTTAAGAVAAQTLLADETAAATTPFLPYSPRSFFKSRVNNAPIDAARTAEFHDHMRTYRNQQGVSWPRINGLHNNKWGMPYARGLAGHPIWRLTGSVPPEVAFLETRGFHAPPWLGQILTGTNDSPFVVMDRGFDGSVWASSAKIVGPRTIAVGNAGWFQHNSNGLDRRNPRSNSSVNYRSRGAIPDALVIRRDAVSAAVRNDTGLGYVLHLFLCKTDARDGFCHPMVACEPRHVGGFGAEGERVRIKQHIHLRRRGLSGAALAVARTLRDHGAYIGDNAGNASVFKAQQESMTRRIWAGTNLTRDCFAGKINWSDFEVVRRGWQ